MQATQSLRNNQGSMKNFSITQLLEFVNYLVFRKHKQTNKQKQNISEVDSVSTLNKNAARHLRSLAHHMLDLFESLVTDWQSALRTNAIPTLFLN